MALNLLSENHLMTLSDSVRQISTSNETDIANDDSVLRIIISKIE